MGRKLTGDERTLDDALRLCRNAAIVLRMDEIPVNFSSVCRFRRKWHEALSAKEPYFIPQEDLNTQLNGYPP